MSGSGSSLNIGIVYRRNSFTAIHNIELIPNRGGQIVRAGGTSAKLLAREGDYITLRLPSKKFV
jgi:ribosomal protein L2